MTTTTLIGQLGFQLPTEVLRIAFSAATVVTSLTFDVRDFGFGQSTKPIITGGIPQHAALFPNDGHTIYIDPADTAGIDGDWGYSSTDDRVVLQKVAGQWGPGNSLSTGNAGLLCEYNGWKATLFPYFFNGLSQNEKARAGVRATCVAEVFFAEQYTGDVLVS